jgi:NADP-dependent 3-hydroxy acid dehydrogenase YdfG
MLGPSVTHLLQSSQARCRHTERTSSHPVQRPDDIADTVACIVTRDRRAAVNEILVRAAGQTW